MRREVFLKYQLFQLLKLFHFVIVKTLTNKVSEYSLPRSLFLVWLVSVVWLLC